MVNALDLMDSVENILKCLSAEERQHMLRVGVLVSGFAKRIQAGGLYGGRAEQLWYFGEAAYYHDIGKAWISPAILAKPGKLTQTEMREVRNHTLHAQRLFEKAGREGVSGISASLFRLAGDAAVYHHEWWNGGGYPYGMKREEIPLIARITSICDAFDAITSNRVYRKGRSCQTALEELKRCAGTQFDPILTQLFVETVEKEPTLFYHSLLLRLQLFK